PPTLGAAPLTHDTARRWKACVSRPTARLGSGVPVGTLLERTPALPRTGGARQPLGPRRRDLEGHGGGTAAAGAPVAPCRNRKRRSPGTERFRGSSIDLMGRRPTLPPGFPGSTIGAGGLNFSVRNGKRCDPSAKATPKRMTAEI